MTSLLTLGLVSFRKELLVVAVTLGVIVSLPVVALASVTNIGVLNDSSVTLYAGPVSTTDTYAYGNCTYWAALRREQAGYPIPANWGNAHTWAINAILDGYRVDKVPSIGAVMQTTAGALGHVAFVESVMPDGSWTVSEMNVLGWDILGSRVFRASDGNKFNFIH